MHASCASLATTVPIVSGVSPRRPITRVPLRVAPTPNANTTASSRQQESPGSRVSVRVAEKEESMSEASSGPSVLVVGAGRVGTYLACKFANAGGSVVLKGSKNPRNPSGHVDALCKEAGVELIRDYDTHRDRKVDYVFISVKTYDLPGVKAELDEHGIEPRIAILVHNGIIAPLFDKSVRVVIPQSYDFVDCPGEGCGVKIHVKNEEKPWVMPATPEAKEVEAQLLKIGVAGEADPQFPYGLIRKFFINGVANLLAIVGDCNCNGLLDNHMERMESLYKEFMVILKEPHADAFAMLPDDFHDVVFKGLASYGEHYPSTKMDFDAGLQLEIDSLNGYVCKMARDQGIASPANDALVEEVKGLVAKRDAANKKKKKKSNKTKRCSVQ